MTSVSFEEFSRYSEVFLPLLEKTGIVLTRVSLDGKMQYLEKAGLLAGAGAIKAIEEGRVQGGQTVVCALTGGAGLAPEKPPRVEHWIPAQAPLEETVRELAKALCPATA